MNMKGCRNLFYGTMILIVSSSSVLGQINTRSLTTTAIKPSIVDTPVLTLVAPKLTTVYVQKWGQNWYNCGSSTKPCATINQGIFRVAATNAPFSDTSLNSVIVGPGEYNENVNVNKSGIKIVSMFGADVTKITAQNAALDTVDISSDGVYFGKLNKGLTLTGSTGGSGLFSTGSEGIVEGNRAIDNAVVGFQFGEASAGTAISGTTVSHNVAESNGTSGFYFYDFDNGTIDHNEARATFVGTGGPPGPGMGSNGSGFWIDSNCSDDVFEDNVASGNEGTGVFYRRFGVTGQITRNNKASENGLHGFLPMGDLLGITNNVAMNNQGDGFHFMGYDLVEYFTYNTAIGNTGAGVVFGPPIGGAATVVDNLHHNNYINNDSIAVAGHNNCGIVNNLGANLISSENDFWGDMNTPGPGPDPADDLCGQAITVTTPASSMNLVPIIWLPSFPLTLEVIDP